MSFEQEGEWFPPQETEGEGGKKKEMIGGKSLPRGDNEDVHGRHLPQKTGGEGQRGQRQWQASTMRDRW